MKTNTSLSIKWGISAIIIAKGLSFVTTLVQTNFLGAHGYGEYGVVLVTLSLFGIVAQGSLGSAAANLLARDFSENKIDAGRTLGAISLILLGLTFIASTLLFLASGIIANVVLNQPSLETYLRIASITVGILAGQSVLEGALVGAHSFRARNSMNVVQVTVFLVLSIVLTPLFGVIGAILAFTLSNVCSAVYAAYSLRIALKQANIKIQMPITNKPYLNVASFILPMILNAVLVIGTNWFITTTLARNHGGLSDVGVFSAATQMRTFILAVPFLLHSTYGSLLSLAYGQRDIERLHSLYLECYRATQSSSVPVAALLIVFSVPIMSIFGKDFQQGTYVLAMSCVLAVVMSVANLSGILLQAVGQVRLTIIPNTMLSILTCVLAPFLIAANGIMGLLIALLIAQGVQMSLLYWAERRCYPTLPDTSGIIVSLVLLCLLTMLAAANGIVSNFLKMALLLISIFSVLANMPTAQYNLYLQAQSIKRCLNPLRYPK